MSSATVHKCVGSMSIVLLLTLTQSAEAATVRCNAADVQCLITAIDQANNGPHHKTTIHLDAGTYALSAIDNDTDGPNGLPSINSTVVIEADEEGATLSRAAGAPEFRLLHVGPAGRLTLVGLHLVGGNAPDVSSTNPPLAGDGGALLNDRGTVTIHNCLLDSNSADRAGGAVFSNLGTLTIADSTVSNNFASSGGGLSGNGGSVAVRRTQVTNNDALSAAGVEMVGGDLRIGRSRITDNSAAFDVGGLHIGGGTALIHDTTFAANSADGAGAVLIDSQSTVTVRDSAFIDNLATEGIAITNLGTTEIVNTTFARNGCCLGASVVENHNSMTIRNSTFADNGPGSAAGSSGNILSTPFTHATTVLQNVISVHNSDDLVEKDCVGGGFISLGNNLIGNPATCNLQLQPTDLVGDAGLGPLVDDGTPGNAHFPLLPVSQAIDAANAAACPKEDQVGERRRPRCDIGAIEFRRERPSTHDQDK